MKKSTMVLSGVVLLGVIGLALVPWVRQAVAHGPGPFGRHHSRQFRDHGHRLAGLLDLSPGQRARIEAIRQEAWAEAAPLRQALDENRGLLWRVARTLPLDEAEARNLASAQAATQTELTLHRVRTMNRIQAVLTPEQREKASNLPPMPGEGWGPNGHGRPEPGPGCPPDA